MEEYISRKATLDAVCHTCFDGVEKTCDKDNDSCGLYDFIKRIPKADVVKKKHGRWVKPIIHERAIGWEEEGWYCSKCGVSPWWCGVSEEVLPPYCPWCGAEMDLPQEG